jgi:hypothetical protein
MNRIKLTFGIFLLLLFASCSGRKNKIVRTNLIPEKDLITILTEVHLADGLLSIPKIQNIFENTDSIMNYIDIIRDNGYTKEAMDRTMNFYFVKKPKKLIKIYDKVLSKLSEMATRVEKELPTTNTLRENIWKGNRDSYLPDPSGKDALVFDQHLLNPGDYTLTFTVTLYPDDQSLNPRFTSYFCNPDSIETGKRDYFPSVDYIKDGRPHTYSFTKRPQSKTYMHLRGWFIDCDNNKAESLKHVRIDNISLSCIPSLL